MSKSSLARVRAKYRIYFGGKRDLGLPMYDAPNAVEELKQPRKHPMAEKVEAIKDVLRYFGI